MAIKIMTQTSKVIRIVYEKYITYIKSLSSAKEGYAIWYVHEVNTYLYVILKTENF